MPSSLSRDADDAAPTRRQRALIMTAVLLGTLLSALDQTITATAGPQIIAELDVSPGLYDWITTAYSLASTVLMPIWGKASDNLGRRPVLIAGMLLFCSASLACGLAPGFFSLVAFRALQGAGAAALLTSSLAVAADLFPPATRAKVNGLFAAMWGIAGVLGPLVGGILTDSASWRWTFFINLPIGAVAFAFILGYMPRLGGGRRAQLDPAGVLALCAATVPLLLALTLARGELDPAALAAHEATTRWTDPGVLALFSLAFAGAGAFVLTQARSQRPILDLRQFSEPVFRWGVLATLIFGMVLFIGVVFAPLYVQRVLGKSSTGAGAVLAALTVGMVSGNIGAGMLASRFGSARGVLLGGGVGGIFGFLWVALTLGPSTTTRLLSVQLAVLGVCIGPLLSLFVLVVQNAVTKSAVGATTAAVSFFRQIGSTAGIAVSGTVFAVRLGDNSAEAMTRAVAGTFWLGAGLCVLGVAATLVMPHQKLRRE